MIDDPKPSLARLVHAAETGSGPSVTFYVGEQCRAHKISSAVETKVDEQRDGFDGVLLALDKRHRTAWAFHVRAGEFVDVAAARGSGLVIRESRYWRFKDEHPQLLVEFLQRFLRRTS